jgi:DNA sulfur modification protein DndE
MNVSNDKHALSMSDIAGASFSCSAQTKECSGQLKSKLGFTTNYQMARLAIGRSMVLKTFPDDKKNGVGSASLKGEQLFGSNERERNLWIAFLMDNLHKHNPTDFKDLALLQNAVTRHWNRGADLLWQDFQDATSNANEFNQNPYEKESKDWYKIFMEHLASLANLPNQSPIKNIHSIANDDSINNDIHDLNVSGSYAISIDIGKQNNGEPFNWVINAKDSHSPHVAIMGKSGSGKTRFMLQALQGIKKQDKKIPVILLDLGKGELATNQALIESMGATVLNVPSDSIPLDFFYGSNTAVMDSVLAFREILFKLGANLGPVQEKHLKEALLPHFTEANKMSLANIKEWLDEYYAENKLKEDGVTSLIDTLTSYKTFEPILSPEEFFSKSWIVTFAHAQDSVKNVCVYLLLDAFNSYLKKQTESQRDSQDNRRLKYILAIDEARNLLDSKHKALSDIVRLHRSKGAMVMLASQSPSDYDGQADDYLENIGLPVCFNTNATSTKTLKNLFKANSNDLNSLKTGECLTIKDQKPVVIKAF